ncbi:MAG: hypothetical protein WAX22_02485 [Lactococcus hircilactis]
MFEPIGLPIEWIYSPSICFMSDGVTLEQHEHYHYYDDAELIAYDEEEIPMRGICGKGLELNWSMATLDRNIEHLDYPAMFCQDCIEVMNRRKESTLAELSYLNNYAKNPNEGILQALEDEMEFYQPTKDYK